MLTRIVYRGGVVIPDHSHPAEQLMLMEQGRLWAKVGTEESEVGPGSLLIIPSDWSHAFRQLSDEDVVFYECFVRPTRVPHRVQGTGRLARDDAEGPRGRGLTPAPGRGDRARRCGSRRNSR